MEQALLTIAYIVASIFFILSLRGLSSQETAQRGNLYGMLGMGIAVVATMLRSDLSGYALLGGVILLGALIGAWLAYRVVMTAMPELVAILHSFVGLAAVLVGYSLFLEKGESAGSVTLVEIGIDVFIGAITFTGSVIAWAKLRGSLSGTPLLLPGRHLLNLLMLVGSIALIAMVATGYGSMGLTWLLVMTGIAGLLGIHLVLAIGGADMPVVVSMLNSYSGWTASAAGFMLENDLLIVTGALVGSSGAILSYIMCEAMNRSIWNVIFGGFGTDVSDAATPPPAVAGDIQETDVAAVVAEITGAKKVILVPGYGMAVARAQYAVREMVDLLRARGITVTFGIHPVAGRLPGHMNVLLAEANVPYDIVHEMEEMNHEFPETELSMVIGANDIVNPGAQTDTSSPIYGMPVLEVWKSGRTVMLKRSRRVGYAGVDNPLFYHEGTRMLFGDAKDSIEAVVAELRSAD